MTWGTYHFQKKIPEFPYQNRTRQIQPLIPIMIPIVQITTPDRGGQQPVHHIPQQPNLPRGVLRSRPHMREHIFPENFLRVLDPFIEGRSGDCGSIADMIQGRPIGLDDKGLVEGGPQPRLHLVVLVVEDYSLENVDVVDAAQRAEQDANIDGLFHAMDLRHDGSTQLGRRIALHRTNVKRAIGTSPKNILLLIMVYLLSKVTS